MALLLKNGAVFLHLPKTGGTWVTRVLRDAGLVRCRVAHKHADLTHVDHAWRHYPTQMLKRTVQVGPSVQSRVRTGTKFCTVRHPLRWYASFFRFMHGLGWPRFGGLGPSTWHPNAPLHVLGADTLDGFMTNVLDTCPGHLSRLYASFTGPMDGAGDDAGVIRTATTDPRAGCLYVGRQERLAEDLLVILDRLGQPVDADAVRATAPANTTRSGPHPNGDTNGAPKARPDDAWDPGIRRAVIQAEAEAFERYGYDPDDVR